MWPTATDALISRGLSLSLSVSHKFEPHNTKQVAQLSPRDRAVSVETVRNVAQMFAELQFKSLATGE